MLLERKKAIIYGGGGAIGSAVARAFAAEGARVYLAGRTLDKLERTAQVIRAGGGQAYTAQLDALDEQAVDAHADGVASNGGSIDISFNLMAHGDVQGTPLVEMTLEDYVRPVETAVRTLFLTSRAAARHMIVQRSGVILVFGGEGEPPRGNNLGGLQTAFHAMGRLVVTEYFSVNGVIEAPSGSEQFERVGWIDGFSRGADGNQFKVDETMASDAQLLGRITYEGFAAVWPQIEGEFADKFNSMPKYVVSSTLKDPHGTTRWCSKATWSTRSRSSSSGMSGISLCTAARSSLRR